MSLENEIKSTTAKVRTDSYDMSVGELINMYRDGELKINPEFQRLFRWHNHQKAKFIESLLLSIPIPSIFVFETDEGKWELIDGLQRMSTILEFIGILKDQNMKICPASNLQATKYLPSLEGVSWKKLGSSEQFTLKRARIGVQILRKLSDERSKYDLFQRLNAGGSSANSQELRNCQVYMANKDFYAFTKRLSKQDSFKKVIQLTEIADIQQVSMEFVMRFFAHVLVPYDGTLDVEEYIDQAILEIAESFDAAAEKTYESLFNWTFDTIFKSLGANGLRRFSSGKFSGKVGRVGFELIAVGIGQNKPKLEKQRDCNRVVKNRTQEIWNSEGISKFMTKGLRGTDRIKKTVPYGREWFSKTK